MIAAITLTLPLKFGRVRQRSLRVLNEKLPIPPAMILKKNFTLKDGNSNKRGNCTMYLLLNVIYVFRCGGKRRNFWRDSMTLREATQNIHENPIYLLQTMETTFSCFDAFKLHINSIRPMSKSGRILLETLTMPAYGIPCHISLLRREKPSRRAGVI